METLLLLLYIAGVNSASIFCAYKLGALSQKTLNTLNPLNPLSKALLTLTTEKASITSPTAKLRAKALEKQLTNG